MTAASRTVQDVIRLHRDGLTLDQITAQVGMSRSWVWAQLRNAGLTRRRREPRSFTPADGGQLLTVAEVATVVGVNPKTVYRWVADGKLCVVRTPGRQIRVPSAQIEQALAGQVSR